MKFNLKNPLWKINPEEAKKGLEKELNDLITVEDESIAAAENSNDFYPGVTEKRRAIKRVCKEILGE